ncbi:hypothetical protein P5V15_001496 [Pogonomyrmex californicus]
MPITAAAVNAASTPFPCSVGLRSSQRCFNRPFPSDPPQQLTLRQPPVFGRPSPQQSMLRQPPVSGRLSAAVNAALTARL